MVYRFILLFAIAMLSSGCVLTQSQLVPSLVEIEYQKVKSPKSHGIKAKVEFVTLKEERGFQRSFESWITNVLGKESEVRTGNIDRIKSEQRTSEHWSTKDRIRAGNILNIDTLIEVDYGIASRVVENPYEYKRIKGIEIVEHCTKKTYLLNFSVKLTNIETGAIGYSGNFSADDGWEDCAQNSWPIPPIDTEMYNKVWKDIVGQLNKKLRPHLTDSMLIKVSIMAHDSSNMPKDVESNFKQALKFFQVGLNEEACRKIEESLKIYNSSVALYYNFGVCSEINNDFASAKYAYEKANSFSSSIEQKTLIKAALNRI